MRIGDRNTLMYRVTTLFVSLSVVAGALCSAQTNDTRPGRTKGLNNGVVWGVGTAEEKKTYVMGIADGVFLQLIVKRSETKTKQDTSLYPKGILTDDIVQALDSFYADRTNTRVAIVYAYLYVMKKIRGASQQELDSMVANFRRRANQ